ncbi:MAG TPA: ABC transporter ATP-binding protein [Pedomonas sp.]|uniref:ABC transporter ATP-binding protein n=1 Tax=Pedomonas sp. TaxID=2976421 RepID=UPI002F41DB0B
MSTLACEDLTVDVPSRRLVGPVNVTFRSGEVTAVLGPNGAGKSTWLASLCGGREPSSGSVFLDFADLSLMDPRERALRIGFLAQGREVAWGLDVETVVRLGRLPYGRTGISTSPADDAAVEDAINRCELGHLRDRNILTLSGGERARVLLARVLAGEPDWILADEPLAGLDPAFQLDIVRLLRELAQEGRGVIVTLHDLALVGRLADRVIVMRTGKVVADGPPVTVLTPDVMSVAYGVAVEVVTAANGERVVLPTQRLRLG